MCVGITAGLVSPLRSAVLLMRCRCGCTKALPCTMVSALWHVLEPRLGPTLALRVIQQVRTMHARTRKERCTKQVPDNYCSWRKRRRTENAQIPHTHSEWLKQCGEPDEPLCPRRRGTRRGRPPQAARGWRISKGKERLGESLTAILDDYRRRRGRAHVIEAMTAALAHWRLPRAIFDRIITFLPPEPSFVPTVELQVVLCGLDPMRSKRFSGKTLLPHQISSRIRLHVACRMSHVACRMSHVAWRMAHGAWRMVHVASRMLHVACRMHMMHVASRVSQVDHVSQVARRTSHVARRTSHVARRMLPALRCWLACRTSHVACRMSHVASVALLVGAADEELAEASGALFFTVNEMKQLNRNRKLVRKFFTAHDHYLASASIIKQIPRLMGPSLGRVGRFPGVLKCDGMADQIAECRRLLKFQLKKVLTQQAKVGSCDMPYAHLIQNVSCALRFLASLLPRGWQNVQQVTVKSTHGASHKLDTAQLPTDLARISTQPAHVCMH